MKTKYEQELQTLKPHDEVQCTLEELQDAPYRFIMTAGHGYLIVPKDDWYAEKAAELCSYGFTGKHAWYLEEDCEAPAFLRYAQSERSRLLTA